MPEVDFKNVPFSILNTNHRSVYLKLNGQKSTQPALDRDTMFVCVRVYSTLTHFSPSKIVYMPIHAQKKHWSHWNWNVSNDVEKKEKFWLPPDDNGPKLRLLCCWCKSLSCSMNFKLKKNTCVLLFFLDQYSIHERFCISFCFILFSQKLKLHFLGKKTIGWN